MAVGVDIDTSGSPWVITYNGSTAAHTLPYVVIGAQNGTTMAYPWMPKRIRWVSATAAAGDQVIIKDYPGLAVSGATPTAQRTVVHFIATGAQFVDETKPHDFESYVGMDITTFASGILYIYF